ncbi:MAG: FKBP-type peptidyl-prolyl cis-trans isomerase [Verrucomicrobia bacterium]|nr:FKBP-type peptidyl-prolyl cis-trans isomerase [Verrucomicrobiota bacterium]
MPDAKGASVSNAPAFKSEADKLSYALGVNAANLLRRYSLEVNPALYNQGLRDALSGSNLLLTAVEASAVVGQKQRELASQQQTEKIRTTKERSEKNQKEGEAFLKENKTKEGVVTLASGVQYKVLKAGTGQKPTLDDTVVCHYRGTLIDGTEFDSTAKRGRPATLPLGKVMKGWREALPLMPVGSKWQVVVPPNLAYGARGTGRVIGPNATLVFELELLDIKPQAQQPAAAAAGVDDKDGPSANKNAAKAVGGEHTKTVPHSSAD